MTEPIPVISAAAIHPGTTPAISVPQDASRAAAQASWQLPLWGLVAVVCAYLLLGLDRYGLLNNNEGLYAEIAREMVQEGLSVIPRLNGLVYIEKPPFFYYLLAASFSLFGASELAARLVSVAASAGCLASLLWFAARLGLVQAGRIAALMLVSSGGYVLLSRTVMPDMLFAALLNGALFLAYLAITQAARAQWRLSLVLLALAVLTKGLVALALFGLILAVYMLLCRRSLPRGTMRVLADPAASLLFFAIAVPWHVAAALQQSDFAWFYVINEHVLRFLGMREPHDYYSGSALYYLPRLLLFLFPWPVYLFLLLHRASAEDEPARNLRTYLGLAVLVPLAFFSASVAKANYYMVVAMPALALLLALRVERLARMGRNLLLAIPIGIIVFGIFIALARFLAMKFGQGPLHAPTGSFPLRALATAAFLGLGALSYFLLRRGRLMPGMLAASLMFLPFLGVFVIRAQEREPYISARPLAREILRICPDCPVYLYKDFERLSALPFYLRKPVGIIDSASNDLEYGRHHSDGSRFSSSAELAARREPVRSVVVVHDQRTNEFRASPLYRGEARSVKLGRTAVYLIRHDRPE